MKKLIIFIILFFIIGGYLIATRNNLDIKENLKDQKEFLSKFTGWIFKLGGNVKEITSLTTKQEWLPDKEENKTE